MTSALPVTSAVRTDPGRLREINQDAGGRFEPADAAIRAQRGCLYVIADGVGGHAAGEVAAEYAVEQILHSYYALPWQGPEATLTAALRAANADIYAEGQREPSRRGMGCTIVAAAVLGEQVIIAHAGDSRAYLVRAGAAQVLTQDHSWIAPRIAAGELTAEQAKSHPNRNVIVRNLGGKPEVSPDVAVHQLLPGDRLLLCSDGLWGPVSDLEIATLAAAGVVEQAADALVTAANLAGGPDNIGIVLIAVDPAVASPVLPAALASEPAVPSVPLDVPAPTAAPAPTVISVIDTSATPLSRPAPSALSEADTHAVARLRPPRGWGRMLPAAAGVGVIVVFLCAGLILAGRRLGPDDVVADVARVASVSPTAGTSAGGSGGAVVSAPAPKPEDTACANGEMRAGFAPYCVKEGEPFSLVYDRCAIDTVLPEAFRRALVQPNNTRLGADPAALQAGLVWMPLGMAKAACGGVGDMGAVPASATALAANRTVTATTPAAAGPRPPVVQPTVRAAVPQPAPVQAVPIQPAPVQPAPVFSTPVPPARPTLAPETPNPLPTERPGAAIAPTPLPTAERTMTPERTVAPPPAPIATPPPPTEQPTALPTPVPQLPTVPPPPPTALPTATRPPAPPPTPPPTPEPPAGPVPDLPGGRDNQG